MGWQSGKPEDTELKKAICNIDRVPTGHEIFQHVYVRVFVCVHAVNAVVLCALIALYNAA